MRIIKHLSLSWLCFCIGGLVGAIIFGGGYLPWWLWLFILTVGELPLIICKIILLPKYLKFRKEYIDIMDDFPDGGAWLYEKSKLRQTAKHPFLYE